MKKITTLWSILGICLLSLAFNTVNAQEPKNNSYDKTVEKVTSGVSTVYEDVKSTAPKIEKALQSIGKELKVGASNVWQILVKQQRVWSIGYLFICLSAIINWIIYHRKYKLSNKMIIDPSLLGERDRIIEIPNPLFDKAWHDKYSKSEYASRHYDSEREDRRYAKTIKEIMGKEQYIMGLPTSQRNKDNSTSLVLHFLLCVALSLLSLWHGMDMFTGFFNPEFGAMKTIAEIATQIK